MDIRWKPGTMYKVDAEVAYTEMEKARSAAGAGANTKELAEAVVKRAKSKRNPLHGEFEWDDAVAAHEHRVFRAKSMIRHISVKRDDIATSRPQRMYHVVTVSPQKPGEKARRAYRTTDEIMKDPDSRAELLGRALNELISFRNRFRDLQELAVVLRSIEEVIETVQVE